VIFHFGEIRFTFKETTVGRTFLPYKRPIFLNLKALLNIICIGSI